MLDKCLNPECSKPFLYLHHGRLFHFERAMNARAPMFAPGTATVAVRHSSEFFWLCDNCSHRFTLRDATG